MMCIYVLDKNRKLVFDKMSFFIESVDGLSKLATIHCPFFYRLLSKYRLGERFLRIGVRGCGRLSLTKFVVSLLHKVWLLDIDEKTIVEIQSVPYGYSDPLNYCSKGNEVIWGDYGDNAKHDEVHVYRLNADLKLETVYVFSRGKIRHVHNIRWDSRRHRFFIFTGDLEEGSGIYEASADWSEVNPLFIGQQRYRAVVGFPYDDGIIYATDAVEEKNHIYLIKNGELKKLSDFPGSCIYGTETKEYFVFSSTVEPPEGRGLLNMFSNKLGRGINDRYAHLITVRKNNLKVEEILKVKKDVWPMKLFQYGSLMFPKGQEQNDELWYNIMACKGDGKIEKVELR